MTWLNIFLEDKVPNSPESCPRGVLGQAICHRLCTVVAALHELSQSALPDGPCTEAALKVSASSARVTYEFLVAFFPGHYGRAFPFKILYLKQELSILAGFVHVTENLESHGI